MTVKYKRDRDNHPMFVQSISSWPLLSQLRIIQ